MELTGSGGGQPVRSPDAAEQDAAREAIRAFAKPRLTGTAGAEEVAADLRGRFTALGYDVRDLPFTFSTLPGRIGVPVLGLVLLVGLISAAWFVARGSPGYGLFAAAMTGALLALAGTFGRAAVLRLPLGRTTAANWLVQRPGAKPRYLIVAHRDSKSQPLPLLLRIVAAVLALIGLGGMILISFAGVLNAAAAAPSGAWILAALGGLGALGFVLSWAGNVSPGALDNASGLAVLLGLAAREKGRDDVAFLVTEAEELGLAGAMAVIPDLPPVFGAIVLDGIDDGGEFQLVERFGFPRRGLAPHLAAALLGSSVQLGVEATRRSLPLGLLVEHMVFTEAGLPALTLMKGTPSSLWRVHGRGDDAATLNGSGAALAVALLSGALEQLRQPQQPTPHVLPEGLAVH
jgi:hypothetical protein